MNWILAIQSVAQHYTNWAILIFGIKIVFNSVFLILIYFSNIQNGRGQVPDFPTLLISHIPFLIHRGPEKGIFSHNSVSLLSSQAIP
jgi:hypothetical protein